MNDQTGGEDQVGRVWAVSPAVFECPTCHCEWANDAKPSIPVSEIRAARQKVLDRWAGDPLGAATLNDLFDVLGLGGESSE